MNTCLFPVAGYGTRFLPATKAIPKELFPILTKPILHYAVEEASASGLKNICIVNNKNKKAIENYFKPNPELEGLISNSEKEKLLNEVNSLQEELSFTYIYQDQMLGLGHAVLLAEENIMEPFGVILPDDLCHNSGISVMQQMVDLQKKHPGYCIVAVEEVELSEVSKYGVIESEKFLDYDNVFQVSNMVEKPSIEDAPSRMAIIGRYILTPEIFKFLKEVPPDKNNEIQLTDGLRSIAEKGLVLALRFKGKRFDCGNVDGFLKANNFFSKIRQNQQ